MRLIQKLKIWKELKRLEARVHESPSPSTFVDLGQVYINLGMFERSLSLAEEGLALFPQSNELRKLRKFAKKNQLNGRITELRSKIARGPHPKLYHELAGMYLELGDFEAVQGASEECIRRFPEDAGAHLVLARAWLTSYYRDLRARQGFEAIRTLQRVISLDPRNERAHKLLAEVLYRIGSSVAARHHLDVLRDLGSEDPEVGTMFETVGVATGEESLENLIHAVEARGSFARGPVIPDRRLGSGAGSDANLAHIRDALSQIAEFDGVRKAAYIKGAKALVKGEIRDGKDSFLRVARVAAKAAQRASRRMDIGNFNKGIVEGEFGHIVLCSFGDVLAAVLCDEGSMADRILGELQDLVAGSLCMAVEKGA